MTNPVLFWLRGFHCEMSTSCTSLYSPTVSAPAFRVLYITGAFGAISTVTLSALLLGHEFACLLFFAFSFISEEMI